MKTTTSLLTLRSWSPLAALAISSLLWTGATAEASTRLSARAVAAMTPSAEVVKPLEALHLAKEYVATHAGTDFMIGSGDSMLPVYKDHTVIVTKQVDLADLKPGMTVVFIGDKGFPVAHSLVKHTSEGWIAMGVGNKECDETRVTADNLMGVVVKAYEPTSSPMLALLRTDRAESFASLR